MKLRRSNGRGQSETPSDYGVAVPNEARSSTPSVTHTFLRCRPRIAPVTRNTLPGEQDASLTKAISYGASTNGSALSTVWEKHGEATADNTNPNTTTRMFVFHQPASFQSCLKHSVPQRSKFAPNDRA